MNGLVRVARVEAVLAPYRWLWANAHRDLIAEHWRLRRAARPSLFNGRVLMVAAVRHEGEVLRAEFFETDYADMIAWIEHGFPGEPVWNGFSMGALRDPDGVFVLGRMADHTANAGRHYFPCGTPDRSDIAADGTVDLAGSLTREIAEETGLGAADYRVDPGWIVVGDRGLLAFMRVVRLSERAERVAERILAHLASETRPELAGIELVRRGQALPDAMPGVLPIFFADAFGPDG